MKPAALIGTVALLLTLGVTVPAHAQQSNRDRGQQQKQSKQAGHAHQARAPQQKARNARPAGHARVARAPQQHGRQARPTRAATARRAGGYHGRIPAARFRANFGAGHRFHMNRFEMVGGHRRFYYGGYWFSIPGAWPPGWAYTSFFYITYVNGGYYLCDPQYPGTQIVISLVL